MTLRARDIADLCDDLAIERASVTVKEGWDHNAQFFLTFGPPAYRQTMVIEPKSDLADVRLKLSMARIMVEDIMELAYGRRSPAGAHPLVGAITPSPEAKPSPAATPAPAKGKRKAKGNAA